MLTYIFLMLEQTIYPTDTEVNKEGKKWKILVYNSVPHI